VLDGTLTEIGARELLQSLAEITARRLLNHGFRVQGSGFRVQGSGFRVQGSGFRV
jgi:hypothetical protein